MLVASCDTHADDLCSHGGVGGLLSAVEDQTMLQIAEKKKKAAEAAKKKVEQTSKPEQVDVNTLSLEDRMEATRASRKAARKVAKSTRSKDRLRSPICCVLGHVDTGKTKLLDKIRRTNVQEGEAGGITQQIGATYFPMDRLQKQTDKVNNRLNLEYKIPGLLVIDTPGHEAFSNLRTRGSSLCDVAVLVVDIMHGLEAMTIESLKLLRARRTPFVVALNKVDCLYDWDPKPNTPIRKTLSQQKDYVLSEFETRVGDVIAQFQAQGLNAVLYYENEDYRSNLSLVPTSAFTGEGVPDLLMLVIQITQQLMTHKLEYMPWPEATVLEVKSIEGLGTTIDIVLLNGELHQGDTIVVCGMNGPIVTNIRALLTPKPMREIRVRADYVHHKSIEAAMGIKIAAPGLEHAVAGTQVLVLRDGDEVEALKEDVMEDLESVLGSMDCVERGVSVQASTIGSLEALMEHLAQHDPPVPVAHIGLGPLHKKDVIVAAGMLEHSPEYATILAFDVKVTREARDVAQDEGVNIFTADIIYHLTDQWERFMGALMETRKRDTVR